MNAEKLRALKTNIVGVSDSGESNVLLHLDLAQFKKRPCHDPSSHEGIKCADFHSNSDSIRGFESGYYAPVMCSIPGCNHTLCSRSANYLEKMYHIEFYKKKLCVDFFIKGRCNYGIYCALAHDLRELKIQLLHLLQIDRDFLLFKFKTVFCPFNLLSHDKFSCVYAHNYQDFRRKNCQSLIPKQCPYWNTSKRVEIYEDECPNGFSCNYCHGWKEYDYHHSRLKKIICKNGKVCPRQELCSYFHDENDRYVEKKTPFDDFFCISEKNLDYREIHPGQGWTLLKKPFKLCDAKRKHHSDTRF